MNERLNQNTAKNVDFVSTFRSLVISVVLFLDLFLAENGSRSVLSPDVRVKGSSSDSIKSGCFVDIVVIIEDAGYGTVSDLGMNVILRILVWGLHCSNSTDSM